MLSQQLGRTILSGSVLSTDQQAATPDERGSYGELMDLIDGLLADEESEPETAA